MLKNEMIPTEDVSIDGEIHSNSLNLVKGISDNDISEVILEAITEKITALDSDIRREAERAEKLSNVLSKSARRLFGYRKKRRLLADILKNNGFSDVLAACECSEKMKE